MTLTDRIEAKRKEVEQAMSDETRLWSELQTAKEAFDKQFQAPWLNIYHLREKLQNELEALEQIAKEDSCIATTIPANP